MTNDKNEYEYILNVYIAIMAMYLFQTTISSKLRMLQCQYLLYEEIPLLTLCVCKIRCVSWKLEKLYKCHICHKINKYRYKSEKEALREHKPPIQGYTFFCYLLVCYLRQQTKSFPIWFVSYIQYYYHVVVARGRNYEN